MGVVQSVPTQQLSPFYLLSTRDVSRVISFTRPSSRLTFSGKGSTAREDGLGTRLGWLWSIPSSYHHHDGIDQSHPALQEFCACMLSKGKADVEQLTVSSELLHYAWFKLGADCYANFVLLFTHNWVSLDNSGQLSNKHS